MIVSSNENKGLVWQVLSNSGYFDMLQDTDHDLIKKALDGYACSQRLEGLDLLSANKCIIDDMHAFILKIKDARCESDLSQSLNKNKSLHRSSTI